MVVDTAGWSGEGEFTTRLVDSLRANDQISYIRVEDAPASRTEADYNFISNEVFVAFTTEAHREPIKRFGFLPGTRTVLRPSMTIERLEAALTAIADIGAPDYSDQAMLQYLRSERIVAPYQTRGYKLVELVRIYEVPAGGAG